MSEEIPVSENEPELTQEQVAALTETFGEHDPPQRPEMSKNDRAGKLMGLRPTNIIPFDQPCELGYRCPVCLVPAVVDGEFDERLTWSEYEGFLWCAVCDYDYPSALCIDMTAEPDPERPYVHAGRDAAVSVFLDIIEATVRDLVDGRRGEEAPDGR